MERLSSIGPIGPKGVASSATQRPASEMGLRVGITPSTDTCWALTVGVTNPQPTANSCRGPPRKSQSPSSTPGNPTQLLPTRRAAGTKRLITPDSPALNQPAHNRAAQQEKFSVEGPKTQASAKASASAEIKPSAKSGHARRHDPSEAVALAGKTG